MDLTQKMRSSMRWSISFITFIVIGLSRVTQSIDRLPPDPGYDFFENSYQSGLSVLWKTEGGYVDIPRRALAEIVILFPIHYTAIVGTLLWVIMAASAAITVTWIVGVITKSHMAGFVCGLLVVLNPSASESQIGNQSVVKWFLILIVAVCVSTLELEMIPTYVLATLILICGASNPITFAASSPLILQFLTRPDVIRKNRYLVIIGAFIVAFLIQYAAWKSTGSGWRKYEERVYWPWAGSGMFWFYNFLISPLTFLGVFAVALPILPFPKPSKFVINIAFAGLSIWSVPYFLSGMADRYFVVPQILAGICVVTYAKDTYKRKFNLLLIACAFYLLIACVAMAHWYQSMWFLTSGPRWSVEVDHAVTQCLDEDAKTVFIDQFMGGISLDCRVLATRS